MWEGRRGRSGVERRGVACGGVWWRGTWKFRRRSGSLRQAANDEALIQPREKEMSVAWHGHLVAGCQALWRLMHQSDERCPAAVAR